MQAAQTRFHVPESVSEALALIADGCVASTLISGGTHVMPRIARDAPRVMKAVDVGLLPNFREIRNVKDGLSLGPAVTYSRLLALTQPLAPALLRKISKGITGGPQIRNQGTAGGSACYANPASDIPTGLVALGADMHLASRARGGRIVAAADFFLSAFRSALLCDEMLVDMTIARRPSGERWGYVKLKTSESSWPVAVAAAAVSGEREGDSHVSITIGAACETPYTCAMLRLSSTTRLLPLERDRILEMVDAAPVAWWADELTDARYRRRVAGVIAVRAVEDALGKEAAVE